MVRTSGFQPENRSSILLGGTIAAPGPRFIQEPAISLPTSRKRNRPDMKRTGWKVLVAFLLSVALASPTRAATDSEADAAFKAGKYEQAVKIWRELAEQGVAVAQLKLSSVYAQGQGVPK